MPIRICGDEIAISGWYSELGVKKKKWFGHFAFDLQLEPPVSVSEFVIHVTTFN